eukprot:s4223_g3.t2
MSLASVGFACDLEKNRVAGYELTGPVLASIVSAFVHALRQPAEVVLAGVLTPEVKPDKVSRLVLPTSCSSLPRFAATFRSLNSTCRGAPDPPSSRQRIRRVAAVITVHPPKFYALAMFLNDWQRCPAAFEALAVYVVFSSSGDLELFREAINCTAPGIEELWTPVVARAPKSGWPAGKGYGQQVTAAYKKFFGLAAVMDRRGSEKFGLMLDSELSIFDFYAPARTGKACHPGGAWSQLLQRLHACEEAKTFNAARVSDKLVVYNFTSYVVRSMQGAMSGKQYDQALLKENFDFVRSGKVCGSEKCALVQEMISKSLWSWWTDIPWANLIVAKRMLASAAGTDVKKVAEWQGLVQQLRVPRFEHVAYQMWCVLHEGFQVRDVTDLAKEARWGSFLEDPQPDSRFAELKPLWASTEAVAAVEMSKAAPFSQESPPLLIFHADHLQMRFTFFGRRHKFLWESLLLDLLEKHNRTDFDNHSIR